MSSYRSAVCLVAALLSTSVLSAGPALAQTTVTSAPPTSFTLANGMQVVVIPDRRTPVVTEMIWYKVGSADETPGKSGLAHFLEHLMFKGTAKHPAGEFSQTVLRVGGNENASTSVDYTNYYQRVLANDPSNASALIGLGQIGGGDAHVGLQTAAPSGAP